MFSVPGILLLTFSIYLRPQEIWAPLESWPILHVALGLAVCGWVLDLRLGLARMQFSPLDPWVLALLGWALVVVAVRTPTSLPNQARELAISATLYFLIAHGVQTFRALAWVAGGVMFAALFVVMVAVMQPFGPLGCIQIDESTPGDTTSGSYDGRSCAVVRDCYVADAEPGAEYMCEHVGLLGTTTVGRGRIRYRGVLQDPNELALAAGIALPLVYGIGHAGRRRFGARLALALAFGLVVLCALWTRSRGGQLVFVAVLLVPFVRRFGSRGAIVAGALALPLVLFGGRSGAEAAVSRIERADCWAEALSIWRSHPFFGAGLGQFGRFHYLTAHNSFLLVLAELGLPGLVAFTGLVASAVELTRRAYKTSLDAACLAGSPEAQPVVGVWALTLGAALAGLLVGIFFLSFAYHYVLWIYLGLAGAFAQALQNHGADVRIRPRIRDFSWAVAGSLALIVAVFVYTRIAL